MLADKAPRMGSYRPDPAVASLIPPVMYSPDTHEVVKALYEPFDAHGTNSSFLTRMIYNEFKLRLPELLLMRVDKIMMSASLEARVPFLDHRLVELTMDLPDRLRIGDGRPKHLLKKAIRGLVPEATINRRKVGFDAPMSQWLREDFGRHVEAQLLTSHFVKQGIFKADYIRQLFVEHRAGKERAMLIWVLSNLTEWFNHWI
jgi:asparagine synthase (glutamine-hydrolysing)